MEMEKKNIAIIVLAGVLVASGIGNILLALPGIQFQAPTTKTLIVGTGSGPVDLDILNAWDSASNDVIRQVVEGLFMIDYLDPDLKRTAVLAEDWEWVDSTTWWVTLKQGVLFHDGTKFNATAVQWNMERLNWFLNATGNLTGGPGNEVNETQSSTASLYMLDATTPIINGTTINSEFNITFKLNAPFSAFEDTLAYVTAWFLSPASTPKYQHLETATGVLVGTGPYTYQHYIADTEVRFPRWNRYWRTGAYFDTLVFSIIEDEGARNNAMLTGTIDVLLGETESLLPRFRSDTLTPNIKVDDTGAGFSYFYLGMNNEQINATFREAISNAFNYTYMIQELLDGQAVRAYSPLTSAWPQLAGWDQSVELNSPVFNLNNARQILVDAHVSHLDPDSDAGWAGETYATYNYSYNTDNQFRVDLGPALVSDLAKIGIEVVLAPLTWEEYIYTAYGYNEPGGYDRLQLYWVGWGPDYMHPWNMLDPLFNPLSTSNSAQVNHANLTFLMGAAITESDPANQTWIIKQILKTLTEEVYPHVFGFHPLITEVYSADLRNYAGNAVNDFWAYPIYREDGLTVPHI